MINEYIPNPRLAILAGELEALNAELIDEGFGDLARIVVMRHVANHLLRMSKLFVNRPADDDEELPGA